MSRDPSDPPDGERTQKQRKPRRSPRVSAPSAPASKGEPAERRTLRTWLNELSTTVKAVGGVAAAIATIVGLVFLFFPDLRPDPTPDEGSASLSKPSLEQPVTFGQYLDRVEVPREGSTAEQLARPGVFAGVMVTIKGYRNQALPLRWYVLDLGTHEIVDQQSKRQSVEADRNDTPRVLAALGPASAWARAVQDRAPDLSAEREARTAGCHSDSRGGDGHVPRRSGLTATAKRGSAGAVLAAAAITLLSFRDGGYFPPEWRAATVALRRGRGARDRARRGRQAEPGAACGRRRTRRSRRLDCALRALVAGPGRLSARGPADAHVRGRVRGCGRRRRASARGHAGCDRARLRLLGRTAAARGTARSAHPGFGHVPAGAARLRERSRRAGCDRARDPPSRSCASLACGSLVPALLGLFVVTLALTENRSGWLAAVAGTAVALPLAWRRRRLAVSVAAVIGLALALALALRCPRLARGRLAERGGGGRPWYWHVAWQESSEAPDRRVGARGRSSSRGSRSSRFRNRFWTPTACTSRRSPSWVSSGSACSRWRWRLRFVAAFRGASAAAAGGYVAFLFHAGVDWDWEMPAVTVAGLFCGAALLHCVMR